MGAIQIEWGIYFNVINFKLRPQKYWKDEGGREVNVQSLIAKDSVWRKYFARWLGNIFMM